MKVGGTARTSDLNVSGTTPASAVAGKETVFNLNWAKVETKKTLYEKWIELLKELKKSKQMPEVTLGDVLSFYRYHVDENVFIDPFVAKERILAYKISDRFGWIRFYTVDGLEISFEWLYDLNTLAVYFDHLARTEVYEG